jgi:hypothetical protein
MADEPRVGRTVNLGIPGDGKHSSVVQFVERGLRKGTGKGD